VELPVIEEDTIKTYDERRQWATLIIESIGLIGLIVYAVFTGGMWQEMQEQTVDSARAWIGYQQIPGSNLPVAIDGLALTPKFAIVGHYTIENFGNGPAIKVMPAHWVETTHTSLRELAVDAEDVCDFGKQFATGATPEQGGEESPGPMGFVLFPKQTYVKPFFWSGDATPNLKWLYVMGCVAYLDQFKKPHWTRFVVIIGDGKTPVSIASPRRLYTLYNDTDETDVNPLPRPPMFW
jgi:hypothetical protein